MFDAILFIWLTPNFSNLLRQIYEHSPRGLALFPTLILVKRRKDSFQGRVRAGHVYWCRGTSQGRLCPVFQGQWKPNTVVNDLRYR
jgi:hypothetical protein